VPTVGWAPRTHSEHCNTAEVVRQAAVCGGGDAGGSKRRSVLEFLLLAARLPRLRTPEAEKVQVTVHNRRPIFCRPLGRITV
jgi:hypothetical protein